MEFLLLSLRVVAGVLFAGPVAAALVVAAPPEAVVGVGREVRAA